MEITNPDKEGNESITAVLYKIKFIDSARFMASSLSDLVDDLTEGIYKIKFKYCYCFLECESEMFNETTPEKEEFHGNLNMVDITDSDYIHGKRVYKDFEIKNLGEYHDVS